MINRHTVLLWIATAITVVGVMPRQGLAQGGGGACCHADGSCEPNSGGFCDGIIVNNCGQCDSDPPPPCDTLCGACCFHSFDQGGYECYEGLVHECFAYGGDFLGVGTNCNGNACSGGPCCLNDATCVANVDPIECASIGGTFMDWDISCNAVTCKVKVPCPADLTGDAEVGPADLAALLATWGVCPGCPADVDVSGSVGAEDLAELLAGWGACG